MKNSDSRRMRQYVALLAAVALCVVAAALHAQQAPVTAQVEIVKRGDLQPASATASAKDDSDVVVWLSPLDQKVSAPSDSGKQPQLVQRNKAFEPHLLVVQAGTSVQFPNKDPFFHNVFSLFNGKRFDLGLYEAGSSKAVRFDRVGVSFLFCNIHEEMSAVVVAVDSPYFAISDHTGRVAIPNVPDGRYESHAWYERSLPEDLKALERPVTISSSARSLDVLRVVNNPDFTLAHKNKYGQDYVPPPTTGYVK
jgi:plastocyanin